MVVTVCFVLSTLSLGGCGTLCNFGASVLPPPDNGTAFPAVYGGVMFDLAVLTIPSNSSATGGRGSEAEGELVKAALVLADIPVSLIGDTLTLPITLWAHRKRMQPDAESRGHSSAPVDPRILADAPSTATPQVEDLQGHRSSTTDR
jgi:uncharacterized protein YceK